MTAHSSDPPQDAPDPRDEVLAVRLEEHLEAIASGTPPPTSLAGTDPEVGQLQPVIERLHHLARCLEIPPTVDLAASTVDAPAAPPRIEATAPVRLGKFQVVRALGRGGQAATLLAFDPDLQRHVVLKLYHSARTPQEQETVLREGQALARVRSPYVAQCYSAERHDGTPYLVVEYVPGRSLTQRLTAGPMSIRQTLELVRQLAKGLAAVHACGLLHRDIKPGNIILGDDGRPRLVDFGLVAALGSDALATLSGTYPYMAPEQARCEVERIDGRTDLFGLGAVFYELLCGLPPYRGGSRQTVLDAARAGDVTPVRERNPRVPRAVGEMCMRCLAKDPAGRFASAVWLADAVRSLQRRRRLRWPLAAGRRGRRAAGSVRPVSQFQNDGTPLSHVQGDEPRVERRGDAAPSGRPRSAPGLRPQGRGAGRHVRSPR
jgi:serine/threonine-protein kinase